MRNSHSLSPPAPALAPRKAPRQARAQASVAAIVEAAARILGEHGLAGFNTNAVAARAGVSVGSLYQYFPNKDALMAALILADQQQRADRLEALVDEALRLEGAAALDRLISAALARDAAQGQLARILDLEERRLPLGPEIEAVRQRLDGAIARFISAHHPHLAPDAARTAARSLRLCAQALSDGWAEAPFVAEAECRRLLTALFASLGTSGAPALAPL